MRSGHGQVRMKVRVQRHYRRVLSYCKRQDFVVGGPPHSDFTDMDAFISQGPQQACGIARNSLIQHQADCRRLSQAALLSSALSSRFAAANANAC